MKHLKEQFHEELGTETNLSIENGYVRIYDRYWSPEDILLSMSDEIYAEVFQQWLGEHKTNMLDKAEELLSTFEQCDRYSALKTAYKRGAVIPCIGAGLSLPSGYPGWTNFLLNLCLQTHVPVGQLGEMLNKGQYETAAQLLSDDLGVAFNEEIQNTFGIDRDLHGAVQLLPYVFNTPVVTTNFDNVLKRCYENAGQPFSDIIPGTQGDELPRYLGANERVLIKIHGKATTGVAVFLLPLSTKSTMKKQGQFVALLKPYVQKLFSS